MNQLRFMELFPAESIPDFETAVENLRFAGGQDPPVLIYRYLWNDLWQKRSDCATSFDDFSIIGIKFDENFIEFMGLPKTTAFLWIADNRVLEAEILMFRGGIDEAVKTFAWMRVPAYEVLKLNVPPILE